MLGILLRIGLTAGVILLGACNSNSSKPDAPQAFTVTPGDGQVVVTWNNTDSSLQYWIFLAQGASISLNNYTNQPGARVVTPVYTPQIVNGLLNGTQYAFLMNATKNGGPAGPTTASLAATPRLAGVNWTAGGVDVPGGLPSSVNFEAVIFANGLFVTVGQRGAIYTGQYTGVGGVTWTPQVSNTQVDLHALYWNSVAFLAVGDGGTLDYSVDGVNWSILNTGLTQNLRAITAGGGDYVFLGDGGTIAVSSDLLSFPSVPSGTANDLVGGGNVAGNIFALGANGTFLASTTAVNWSPPATLPAVTATLRSVAFGINAPVQRVAVVGDGGTLLTSTDAANFVQSPNPAGTTANLRSVCYASRFVTVGDSGSIFYSDDGLNWTQATSPVTQNLNAVVFGNGAYVAVGDSGANVVSQ